jgi:hypothetical protein
MPVGNKYKNQRVFLAALANGDFDTTQTIAKTQWERLKKTLTDKPYDGSTFFHWFNLFVEHFANKPSARTGKLRSRLTKEKAYRRFRLYAEYAALNGLDALPVTALEAKHFDSLFKEYNSKGHTRQERQTFIDLRQMFTFMVGQRDCPLKFNPMNEMVIPHHKVTRTAVIQNPQRVFHYLFTAIQNIERKGSTRDQERQRSLDLAVLSFMLLTAARRGGVASVRTSGFRWDENEVSYDDKGKIGVAADIFDCKQFLLDYLQTRNMHGPKKGESRTSYLARVAEYNRLHPNEERPVDPDNSLADDYFFRRPTDGFPATSDTIGSIIRRFDRWLKAGNFTTKLTSHVIRKYRGMQAWEETKDLELCRTLLGHGDYNTTMLYLEIDKKKKLEGMRKTSPIKGLIPRGIGIAT